MNLSELSEEELIKLLSLEKEKRIIAERNVEAVNQALLQIKVLLDKRQDSEATLKRSVSSSSNSLNSPLPRAFSQEFYDLILHDLPDEVQSTLAIQGHSSAEGDTPFPKCVMAIDLDDAKKLHQILVSLNDTHVIVQYGTQLVNAATKGDSSSCLKVLLEAGCNPNEPGLQLHPPLLIASKNGHTNCLKILLKYSADINISDSNGCTALYVAIENQHYHIVSVLLKARPNLTCINKYGNTVLHIAVIVNNSTILRMLLVELHTTLSQDQLSDIVNKRNNDGFTPLQLAIKNEHKNCIEILLSCSETVCTSEDQSLVTTEDCQLLLSTKNYKNARVVILNGESIQSHVIIGTVRVLPHHSWDDIRWLVGGALEQFNHVLNGQMGVVYKDDCTLIPPPTLHGKASDDILHLLQCTNSEIVHEIDTVLRARLSAVSTLHVHESVMSCYINGRTTGDNSSPYEALLELEENGQLLEINLELKNGLEWIEFITLYPKDVLANYCTKLLTNKCMIIHGQPEFELNKVVSHLYTCLKVVNSTKTYKISIAMDHNFSRGQLFSMLYENELLQLHDEECHDSVNESYLLVLEGIDKLDKFDVLDDLHMLIRYHETNEDVWIDVSDHTHLKPGKYKLRSQCYVIAVRTLFTSVCQSLPQKVMNDYVHIWLTDSDEPAVGFLLRYLIRELVNARKGELPKKSDFVYQALLWVWQFWLLFNHYMRQFNYFQLTIGPKLFLNCPVTTNNADSIYNWFVEMWNFYLVPKIKDVLLTNGKTNKSNANTFKQMMFFLLYRLIFITCPLPIDATHDFVLVLHGNNDLGNISPVKAINTIKDETVTKSPKSKRSSVKKSVVLVDNVAKEDSPSSEKKKYSKAQRPKSAGIFSKNSTLRKSLFRGSRNSINLAAEEETKKKSSEDENIEDLFDIMMSTGTERMNEQRMSLPPHHVISTSLQTTPQTTPPVAHKTLPNATHSPSQSLTEELDYIRPLSADSTTRLVVHPRVSDLIHSQALPHRRSRSEDNVYVASYDTMLHVPQMSNSSDGLSTSTESSLEIKPNEHSSPPRRLKSYHSTSLLYSATLGNCNSASPRLRKVSEPLLKYNKSSTFTLMNFWPEEEEVEM